MPPEGKLALGQSVIDRARHTDSIVRYVTPGDFYTTHTIEKDSLRYHTHQYDPVRRKRLEYVHLGNLGSAHRRQFFGLQATKGLDIGQHQYLLYQRRFEDFKFYDAEHALTEFKYSQGLDQLDGVLNARFGRNFANGVKTSLDYLRINQKGTFMHQRAKHTTLGFGIWYDSPDGKYDGLYHYGSNSIVQEDNGGISNYIELDTQQLASVVPVWLNDALSVHRQRSFSVQNHFHLNPPADSVQHKGAIDIIHTGFYQSAFVRFTDENISSDVEYYGDFVLDDRGVRHFIDTRSIDNRLDLQFRFNASTQSTNQHLLKAGIQHRFTRLRQEPNEKRINETFLNATGRLWMTPNLSLSGNGYLALTGQLGDFKLTGRLEYASKSSNIFSAELTLYNRSPNVIEQRLFVAQLPVWETDLTDYTHSQLRLVGVLPALKLQFGGMLHLLNNAIYYDTGRKPAQLTGTNQVSQLYLQKAISIGKLGIDVTFALQQSPNELALPGWIAEGQLFYQDRWFKRRLLVRTGLDLRVTDSFRGVNYFPLTGQFHLDDSRQVEQYPAVDVFFDMQVKQAFRAFFKIENITSFLLNDPFIQVVDYPQFESYFRVGLWMKLFD